MVEKRNMNIGNDEKKYWTIKEVSDLTKVKQTTLRFWEQEFFQLRPIKNKFGHRVYTKKDIDIGIKIIDKQIAACLKYA